MAQLNLKALFSADTKDIKKGSKEAQQAVTAFKDEAGNSFDQFAQLFGTSMGELSGHVKVFRGGLLMLSQSFKTTAAGSGFLTTALRVLKTALISTGIGALVVALGSLVAYFTKTQDGGDKLAKIMLQLKAVFGVITDVAAAVGRALSNAFNNPKQAVKDLWEAIKTNIVNRFTGLFQTFGSLGKLISAAFKGNWKEVKQAVKEAGQNGIQAITGLDEAQQKSAVNAINNEKRKLKAALDASAINAALQDDVEDRKRAWIKTEADLQAKLDDLREKSTDKEKYNVDQRLKYSREAEKVLQRLWAGRIALAAEEYNVEKRIYNQKKEHTDEEEEQLNQLYATWRGLESQKSQELKGFHREQLKILSQHQQEIAEMIKSSAPDFDIAKILAEQSKTSLDSIKDDYEKLIEEINQIIQKYIDIDPVLKKFNKIEDFFKDIASALEQGLANIAGTFAEGIGNIFAGTGGIGDLGKNLLSSFGDLLIALGKIAIQTGIGIEAIQSSLASLNPVIAIAAGVALVAFGTAIKSSIQNAGSGNMSAASTSYSSGSVSSSSAPDYTSKSIEVKVSGELTSRGNKLIATINNENSRKKLTS